MATKPIGRGRGRAKSQNIEKNVYSPGALGQLSTKYTPISPVSSQTTNNVVVDPFKNAEASLDLCLRQTTPENLQSCLAKAEEFASNDERIQKLVRSLFEKCLKEQKLAINAGQVAAMLSGSEKMGQTFRNIFLRKFQESYKNRAQHLETKYDKFLAFSTLMCSVYRDLRTVGGDVMKVLTKPVYDVLGELLENKREETGQREKGVQVFRDNLFMVASILQEIDKNRMDELFKNVRNNIVKETSPKIVCILLETFEYYHSGDWTMEDETKGFYSGLMADVTSSVS